MVQALEQISRTTLYDADSLENIANRLEYSQPSENIEWAFGQYGDRVAIATGFGAEGVAMIDMAAKIDSSAKIFFLDTGFLFPETYELRKRIEDRYAVRIRSFESQFSPEDQEALYGSDLWSRAPDLCCEIRKLDPLKEALSGLDGWITAIRRDQTAERASARAVEWDLRWQVAKINPLFRWTRSEVWEYIRRNDLPYNPLHDRGYPSIGCTHCTRAVVDGEDERAGRWAGHEKTECGLHAGPNGLVRISPASI
jgi:phosphoadenosine phosphosulfate reductase